jgi:hypothetical protein
MLAEPRKFSLPSHAHLDFAQAASREFPAMDGPTPAILLLWGSYLTGAV